MRGTIVLTRDNGTDREEALVLSERRKRRRTLSYLPRRTGRTLELGRSIGSFTALLAPRCDGLLAVDFGPGSLDRARRRLGGAEDVELRCRRLPEGIPEGPFDTIVCAEVLHHWRADLVRDGLRRMEGALAPGGTLLIVHRRHPDPRRELDGDEVHAILQAESSLPQDASQCCPDYLLDRRRLR